MSAELPLRPVDEPSTLGFLGELLQGWILAQCLGVAILILTPPTRSRGATAGPYLRQGVPLPPVAERALGDLGLEEVGPVAPPAGAHAARD